MKTTFFGVMRTAFAATIFVLAGCGPMIAVPPASSYDQPHLVAGTGDYLLNVGDVLKITVYGDDTLTGTYAVDQRGNVSMPLAGKVEAAGMTQEQLQKKISASLVKGRYLAKPLVTVDVAIMAPFYILGEVKAPGSYPYQSSLDVFKAIATAGGYTPRAAKNKVLIDRGVGPQRQHFNASEETPVLPGDSITVRERIF